MTSEWMKVMLEEIARKKAEAEQSRLEQSRREQSHREQSYREQERHGDDMVESAEWAARNKAGDAK